jgi:hypothetical protein
MYAIRSLVPECVDDVLASADSPDHRVVGAVIDRGCGATVGFVRGVVLYDARDGFLYDDSNVVYLVEGQGEIVIRWHDDAKLVIDLLEPAEQPYRMHDRWNGVAISYE